MNAQESRLFVRWLIAGARFAVILMCVVSIGFAQSNRKRTSDDAESAAVYSAALEEAFSEKHFRSRERVFAISNIAVQGGPAFRTLDKYDPDAIKSFLQKAKKSRKLENELLLTLKVPMTIVDEEKLQKLSDKERMDAFFKQSVGSGLIRFSPVGFNKSKTKAFFYLEFAYCFTCGFGQYTMLEKENGVWKVKVSQQTWVS